MLSKLIALRDEFLLKEFNVTFYDYQRQVSDKILEALIENLRLTLGATEKEVKKLKQKELVVEFSRQSGKTTAIAYTVVFIITFLPKMFNRKIRIGILFLFHFCNFCINDVLRVDSSFCWSIN